MTKKDWRKALYDPENDYWITRLAYTDWLEECGKYRTASIWRFVVTKRWKPCDLTNYSRVFHLVGEYREPPTEYVIKSVKIHDKWVWFNAISKGSYYWLVADTVNKNLIGSVIPCMVCRNTITHNTNQEAERWLIDRLIQIVDRGTNLETIS